MVGVLRCPRDGASAALEAHTGRGRFVIDVCPKCGGVFLDNGEISKLTREREVERLLVEYASGASGLSCPRCGHGMTKRPVSDFVVDVCPSCRGVWFDVGELENAARSLRGEIPIGSLEMQPLGLGRAEALTMAAFASPSALKSLLRPPKSQVPENL